MNTANFPAGWYWSASDSRVYSAPLQSIVTVADSGYQAFLAGGNVPTVWPKDGAGDQTTASLQAALNSLGLFVDLKSYAAFKRYGVEIAGTTYGGKPVATDRVSQALIAGAVLTVQTNPSAVIQWKYADGTWQELNATQMVALGTAVSAHVQTAFSDESTADAAIDAGTCTTRAQVDEFFA